MWWVFHPPALSSVHPHVNVQGKCFYFDKQISEASKNGMNRIQLCLNMKLIGNECRQKKRKRKSETFVVVSLFLCLTRDRGRKKNTSELNREVL